MKITFQKLILRALLGLFIASAVWHLSYFIPSRPLRLFGDVKVVTAMNANDVIFKAMQEKASFGIELADFDTADVIIAAVFDWAELDSINGLRPICSSACDDTSKSRVYGPNNHYNLFGFQKFFFIRTRAFFKEINTESGQITYNNEDFACLIDWLVSEVETVDGANDYTQCKEVLEKSPEGDSITLSYSSGFSIRSPF